jgi:hypothetical protein
VKKEKTGKEKAAAKNKADSTPFPAAGIGASAGGLEEVKAAGGLALTQAEDQARYPFRPRSALNTGRVAHALPVEKWPETLPKYAKHSCLRGKSPIPPQQSPSTARKKANQLLWSSGLMRTAQNLESIPGGPFLVLDGDLKVITARPGFSTRFKSVPAEPEARQVYELGNRRWDISRLRELLKQIIPPKAVIADFVVEHNFPGLGFKKMVLNARRFQSGQRIFIILAIEEVTPGQGRVVPPLKLKKISSRAAP